jgi:hypothetical protein
MDGWKLCHGYEGWKVPPNGCSKPIERHFAQWEENHNVTAWLEGGFLHVKDDESYYPGGCYWVPLTVIAWLKKHGKR